MYFFEFSYLQIFIIPYNSRINFKKKKVKSNMKANETKFQQILEGTKAYTVPIFQRSYSWKEKEWKILWEDLMVILENENDENNKPKTHFMGAIVSLPINQSPEGISTFLLIDGQQRLTTILILLILIRDLIKKFDSSISDEIHNLFIVNQYKKGNEHYKLIPSEYDKYAYQDLVNGNEGLDKSKPIHNAYLWFKSKIEEEQMHQDESKLKRFKQILINQLSLVSIVLDQNENPYLVFESLNAKGRPLTHADLVRNYLMMHLPEQKQNEIYHKYWKPLEDKFISENTRSNSKDFAEYIRHFLMRYGEFINKNDVYLFLKRSLDKLLDNTNQSSNNIEKIESYIDELYNYSLYYEKLVDPENENNSKIRKKLKNLNRIEVTTAYPLLLNLYNDYTNQKINEDLYLEVLHILETFLIRRFVCNIPTNRLNKIFQSLNKKLQNISTDAYLKIIKQTLSKHMPLDDQFFDHLCNTKIVGSEKQKKDLSLS